MGLLNCSTGPFGIYDCDDHTEEVGVACNPASKLLISLCDRKEIIEDPYTQRKCACLLLMSVISMHIWYM